MSLFFSHFSFYQTALGPASSRLSTTEQMEHVRLLAKLDYFIFGLGLTIGIR